MLHAIAALEVALEVVETNEPINRAEGNIPQANIEAEQIVSFRRAIEFLRTKNAMEIFNDANAVG